MEESRVSRLLRSIPVYLEDRAFPRDKENGEHHSKDLGSNGLCTHLQNFPVKFSKQWQE